MRSTEFYKLAGKRGLGFNTIRDYLNTLRKEGTVRKIVVNPKEIYYCRCEGARLENMIDDFTEEIATALLKLPAEMRGFKRWLEEKGANANEAEKATSNKLILEDAILNTLASKVYEVFRRRLPDQLKSREFYIGIHEETGVVGYLPKEYVENKLKAKQGKSSVKS